MPETLLSQILLGLLALGWTTAAHFRSGRLFIILATSARIVRSEAAGLESIERCHPENEEQDESKDEPDDADNQTPQAGPQNIVGVPAPRRSILHPSPEDQNYSGRYTDHQARRNDGEPPVGRKFPGGCGTRRFIHVNVQADQCEVDHRKNNNRRNLDPLGKPIHARG